jgi:hypothetical protein
MLRINTDKHYWKTRQHSATLNCTQLGTKHWNVKSSASGCVLSGPAYCRATSASSQIEPWATLPCLHVPNVK